MDDRIGRLVAHAGVDQTAAAKAVGVIVQFLLNEGPPEKGPARIRRTSSIADAAVPASSSSVRSPRMGETQAINSETLMFARERAREGAVGRVVDAIPALGRFV